MCCNFCKSNEELEIVYRSHNLKDRSGKTTCPILDDLQCPKCCKKGHTTSYCLESKQKALAHKIEKYVNPNYYLKSL
jgi:hypothetical protein